MKRNATARAAVHGFVEAIARLATGAARRLRFAALIALPVSGLVLLAYPVQGAPVPRAADLADSATGDPSPSHAAQKQADPDSQHCLSRQEQRARIAARSVVPLAHAARTAKGRGGDLLNARLCERNGKLVYLLTVLARNGKVLRVAVDAGTGALVDAGH